MFQTELYLDYQNETKENADFYKRAFLNRLRSPIGSKNKYKRFLGSPLRYAGGKSLAVGFILELIPKENLFYHTTIVQLLENGIKVCHLQLRHGNTH